MKKTMWATMAVAMILTMTGCQVNAGTQKKDIQSIEDLKYKTIACQSGTTGYAIVSEMEDYKTVEYPTSRETFGALLGGSADAVVMDRDVAENMVESVKDKNPEVYIVDQPLSEEEFAIAYNKEDEELGQKLNQALEELKEEGKLTEITSHWIGENADQQSYIPPQKSTSGKKLRMATNATYPPYESIPAGSDKVQGIDVDIMQAVCEKLDMELVVVNVEFESILSCVESKSVDVGVAAITVTDERKEKVSFTDSYAKSSQVIITK